MCDKSVKSASLTLTSQCEKKGGKMQRGSAVVFYGNYLKSYLCQEKCEVINSQEALLSDNSLY